MSSHPPGPPTVESVMSLLRGVAIRWKEIVKGLGFDEDYIEDEIDPNNDSNEGCLRECVEIWVFKQQPSWEKLSHVLRDLGEEELARQAKNRGSVLLYNTWQWLFPMIGIQSHKRSGRYRVGRQVTQAQEELVKYFTCVEELRVVERFFVLQLPMPHLCPLNSLVRWCLELRRQQLLMMATMKTEAGKARCVIYSGLCAE